MSGMAKNTSSHNITPRYSGDMGETVKKKSILFNPEYKRESSKATIQWRESVGQRLEERMKLEKRSRLHALGHLMTHGSKWSYIQELVTKMKAEDGKTFKITRSMSEEDSPGQVSPRGIDSLIRELWHGMLHKIILKGVDLTLDQQANLEVMKYKLKLENDKYLKSHLELDILLSLVYRKLLRTKPDDPKVFVAHYVHYLNTHREEMVLDDVDVPFDRPPVKAEEPDEDMEAERQQIELFARELVQKCAEIASYGSTVANVTNIIDSIMEHIGSSKDESSFSSLRSAEEAARGVLMSMLTSVAYARTKSAEIVVEEVLDSVFERVCPLMSRDSEDYLDLRESVESFVKSLLKTVTDKVVRQVKRIERLRRFEENMLGEESSENEEHDVVSITSKSILKKLPSQIWMDKSGTGLSDKPEFKSKVKFLSVSLPGSSSNDSAFNESLND